MENNEPAWGIPVTQCPKYDVDRETGRIINRATKEPIPDDEPIFIARASQEYSAQAIAVYKGPHASEGQLKGITAVLMRFFQWRRLARREQSTEQPNG